MNETRKGDWIITYTGIEFWPLDPHFEDINLEDIAVTLSRLPRFTGHTKYTYTIAQHSVYVAQLVKQISNCNLVALAALLHDGSEAYTNDISSPLKNLDAFKDFRAIEDNLQDKIYENFDVFPTEEEHKLIKLADMSVFANEVIQLMPKHKGMLEKAKHYQRHEVKIKKQSEAITYRIFMDAFNEFSSNLCDNSCMFSRR